MNKKIAVIESGFMGLYLDSFLKLCEINGILVDIYKQADLKNQYVPKRFFSIFKVNREIKTLLDDKGYDYVLSDNLPLAFGCNVFHNVSIMKRIQLAPFFIYKFIFSLGHFHKILFARSFFKKCPKTIVVSDVLKKDYSENCNIPENTLITAYPGINISSENKFLKFKKMNGGTFTIGMNANGFVTKGGYVLLKALCVLKEMLSEMNLKARIIFPQYEKKLIVKLCVKIWGLSEIVEFLPYQSDMKDYYNSLNCFVCPSLAEAFGRVVVEAMSFKVPVIVSSDVGASEIIKDGENGFLYKKDEKYIKNLAEKILYVYENYNCLENQVENAFETANEITWENFSREILYGLYPELADKKPSFEMKNGFEN